MMSLSLNNWNVERDLGMPLGSQAPVKGASPQDHAAAAIGVRGRGNKARGPHEPRRQLR